MVTPPVVRLVATLRRTVEPLIAAPESIESARKCRVRVIDDSVFECERAHAGPLADVGGNVGTGYRSALGRSVCFCQLGVVRRVLTLIVVLRAARALLFRRDGDGEVSIEVSAERRCPGKRPAHAPFESLQLVERCARNGPEHDVVMGEMHREAVEAVRDCGARRAAGAV